MIAFSTNNLDIDQHLCNATNNIIDKMYKNIYLKNVNKYGNFTEINENIIEFVFDSKSLQPIAKNIHLVYHTSCNSIEKIIIYWVNHISSLLLKNKSNAIMRLNIDSADGKFIRNVNIIVDIGICNINSDFISKYLHYSANLFDNGKGYIVKYTEHISICNKKNAVSEKYDYIKNMLMIKIIKLEGLNNPTEIYNLNITIEDDLLHNVTIDKGGKPKLDTTVILPLNKESSINSKMLIEVFDLAKWFDMGNILCHARLSLSEINPNNDYGQIQKIQLYDNIGRNNGVLYTLISWYG